MFSEAAFIRLPRQDVRDEGPVREHAQDVLARLLDSLAHYPTPLDVTLQKGT